MSVRETFDRSAGIYDQTRRQLVPCFDGFYGTALEALPEDDGDLHVVDLGAGTGLLSLLAAGERPAARFTLVDVAPGMLAIARERFAGEPERFAFVLADLTDVELPRGVDCVMSALAIHHLEGPQKAELFARIHAALRPGGVFVNADQMAGETAARDAENRRRWLDEVRELGTSDDDLRAALDRMQEDRPSTVPEQLAWLEETAFEDVHCAFQHTMFAVLVARKAPGR